ncbi:MAG TPA: AMP-binding protein [Prolixibacteraceae bacterium]|nr:AMP-binding protein [Prolixibacteraceae bacterium]
MGQQKKYTIPAMLRNSFTKFSTNQSLVFVGEANRTYAQLENEINHVVIQLIKLGVSKGDKVAILSSNMPNWGIAYFAITTIGAIAVPILPDFSAIEISNIIEHSESKVMYVSENLLSKIEQFNTDPSKVIIRIESLEEISGSETSHAEISPENLYSFTVEEDDLASIIYTSGTTGKSKGVMLTHKNLLWDAEHGGLIHEMTVTDRFLSLLPLSHTYENTLSLILPVMCGSSVHYLKKLPTPAVLIPALQTVKPTIIFTVPLIIEKIYTKQIKPKFSHNKIIRILYGIAPIRLLLNRIAGKKLMKTFGGKLLFFGIGGAKLDGKVERFLREAKFPYSIGYGLTETAPLIAGTDAFLTRLYTIGPAMPGVELKINQPDPKTGQGEVWAKGPNVMKGYYKDPLLTKEVLTDDGWFKTGDLGSFDKKGYLAFKGRLKNMIVSASGENIFPEEIESVINDFENVIESLVVERKGKLVALVLLNMEELEVQYHAILNQAELFNAKLDELLAELQKHVNSRVNKFSQVQLILIQNKPFERTPTQKIKRFLYS